MFGKLLYLLLLTALAYIRLVFSISQEKQVGSSMIIGGDMFVISVASVGQDKQKNFCQNQHRL